MGKIFSILLALALVLSVGLVPGMPVQAAVSQPEVTVSTVLAGSVAEYTIVFAITSSLVQVNDTITVDFPNNTTVPGSYSDGDITINCASVYSGDVTVADREVTMKAPVSIQAPGPVTVVFTIAANITNPTTTYDYTLWVNTSGTHDTTPVESEEYAIRELPTVTDVSPAKGNVGGTMWVVVEGTSFMGNSDTNHSDTDIDFGAGADVCETKYISVNEINVQIEVVNDGTFDVTAQTLAGSSTEDGLFTANDDDPPAGQVDVWEKYTPTNLTFDEDTLVFDSTTDTITDAIAAASENYVLVAHAAEYEEDLVISDVKEGLTLMSVSGKDATTIKGMATEPWSAYPLATPNIEILADEVKIHGFTIESPDVADDHYSSGIVLTGTDIEIYDNEFVSIGVGDGGCVVIQTYRSSAMPSSDISGLIIRDNEFSGTPWAYVGVFINHTDVGTGTVTVQDNVFSGMIYQGIVTERPNTVISANEMTSTYEGDGIIVMDWDVRPQNDVEIIGNTVEGFSRGIVIGHGGGTQDLTDISVTENTVQDNETGIVVRSSAGGVVVNYNNIAGNTELGLENTDDDTLEALYNWWGHEIGPNHDTRNPGGQLNAVTGNANFSPWLYKPQEQFAHDAPCLAGSVVLANEAEEIEPGSYAGGWNSFSTPVTLDGSANTVSEILALAEESNLYILRAQRFNLATQQWDPVIIDNHVYPPGTVYYINPGEGFYMQVRSKGSLPILVATGITQPPMRDLVAGWNLIGTSNLGKMNVKTALSRVDYSMVLSPKPPNDVAWSVPPFEEEDEELLLGKAYWVAMGEPGILFGFTYTPVASNMKWDLNQ